MTIAASVPRAAAAATAAARASEGVPVEHPPAADRSEVRQLEPYPVGVNEETRVIILRVFRVITRLARFDPALAELRRGALHRVLVEHPKAEVMEARRIRIVRRGRARRPER